MKSESQENIQMPEVLAPAGGMEHLIAAVRSGADAVYIGTRNFNARRNAQNFDEEGLKEAVSCCHARGAKVYATLNTLVFDKEAAALADEVKLIADSAVDGVIVQDLGVAAIVRQMCPDLPLHASTQMTIHSAAGAKALEKLGFKRVVLARELTAAEIGAIAEKTELELEIFVHGALCMSVSGQCYLSSMLGGRSGNRGLCAQPCRLNFSANGREYALSLKDLSLIPRMEELKSLKIAALKIEGRMKRPEYVAAAVTACKAALKGDAPDMETLKAVFSRSGFTDGYFAGKRDTSMFGSRTKEDVVAASPVLEKIAAAYRSETPLVPVDMKLTLQHGQEAHLEVTDGERIIEASGPVPEEAVKIPLDGEHAARSLGKTGGTPFYLDKMTFESKGSLTLPVSAVNGMRKAALNELLNRRGEIAPLPCMPIKELPPEPERRGTAAPELRLRFRQAEQLSGDMAGYAAKVILPVEEIEAHPRLIGELGGKLVGELPLLVFPQGESKIKDTLNKLRTSGLQEVTAGNLGTLSMAKELGFTVHGDYSLNILNSYALQALRELGAADATIPFETGMRGASELKSGIPIGIIAYGYLPLMTFRNCPARGENGCASCSGSTAITDRIRNTFPVVCRGRLYSQLLNMVPLYLADKADTYTDFDFITLYFTTEDSSMCKEILRRYLEHARAEEGFTRGLYFRSLE